MIGKKLCVCVPTYNNSENIDRYISEQMEMFTKYDVDLHIYDSSEDIYTESVICDYNSKISVPIYYHKMDSCIPSNIKVYEIFREMEKSVYEYVWMIHDHTVCTENALMYLLDVIGNKDDFYVLNMQADRENVESYKSLDEFLIRAAWRLNSFGASVIRTDTFLKGVDWERISDKYNDRITLNYSHIGFYFERASEVENLKVCEIYFNRKDFVDFKRGQSINWSKDTIRICMECWGNVITRLPNVYQKKNEALLTQDRWFMSKYSLISYKKNGAYGWRYFLKYKKWIKKMYPKDYIRDFLIAILPHKMSLSIFTKDINERIKCIQKKNGGIYIYGAGRHAIECGQFLDECGINFQTYVVTDSKGNPQNIGAHKVEQINANIFSRPALIIIAVLTSGVDGVNKVLSEYRNENTEIIVFGE